MNKTLPIDGTIAANGGIEAVDESQTSPIAGSPFNVVVTPNKASSFHTRAKGLGLRQAVVNKKYTFEVDVYDKFSNLLISGGTRLYTRLGTHCHSPTYSLT